MVYSKKSKSSSNKNKIKKTKYVRNARRIKKTMKRTKKSFMKGGVILNESNYEIKIIQNQSGLDSYKEQLEGSISNNDNNFVHITANNLKITSNTAAVNSNTARANNNNATVSKCHKINIDSLGDLFTLVEPHEKFFIIQSKETKERTSSSPNQQTSSPPNEIFGYLKLHDMEQFKGELPFFETLTGELYQKGLLISNICIFPSNYSNVESLLFVESLLLNKIEEYAFQNNFDYIVILTHFNNKHLIGSDGLYIKKRYDIRRELKDSKVYILKKYLNYKIIKKICCDKNTQFPTRMKHCEGIIHTAAAKTVQKFQSFGSFLSSGYAQVFNNNIDGIVKLSTLAVLNPIIDYLFTENISYIGDKGDETNFISDHNGINMEVKVQNIKQTNNIQEKKKQISFNVITHNLEGLCRKSESLDAPLFRQNIKKIVPYFDGLIKVGTILLIQEMALQIGSDNLKKQQRILEENTNIVLKELNKINPNLVVITDTYTGAIIYDTTVWNLIQTLQIKRLSITGETSNKFSNAYLMQYNAKSDLLIWFVNIHLKALALSYSQTFKDQTHIFELKNIISKILELSEYNKYPIYFSGDYNNSTDKKYLIEKALKEVYKGEIRVDDGSQQETSNGNGNNLPF